jgi:hypothetical protein
VSEPIRYLTLDGLATHYEVTVFREGQEPTRYLSTFPQGGVSLQRAGELIDAWNAAPFRKVRYEYRLAVLLTPNQETP